MKKSITLIAVLIAFSFASCKKERECVCTTSFGTERTTSEKATKKKAKRRCEERSGTDGNITTTCKLLD